MAEPELDSVGVFEWSLPEGALPFEAGDVFSIGFQAEAPGVIFAASDPPDYPGGDLYADGAPHDGAGDLAFITFMATGVVDFA